MYSRRLTVEEKKNKRKALVFIILTIVSLLLIIFFGLPSVAKFAAFLTDLRKSSEPVETADTTPPPPPRFEATPLYTNQRSLELKGSSEAGASVILFLNNQKEEVLANSEGVFSLTFPLKAGENTFYALAKDNSGNESQKTETQTIVFDNEEPPLEITKPQDGTEFFGSKQRQMLVEGKTESTAKVQINDRSVVVDSEGSFTFVTLLTEGINSFTVKAEDLAGNKSEKSFSVSYSP